MAGYYIVDGRRIGANKIKDSDLRVAKRVEMYDLDVTALPPLPAATEVWAINLPLLTALPELPAATYVWAENLPLLKNKA